MIVVRTATAAALLVAHSQAKRAAKLHRLSIRVLPWWYAGEAALISAAPLPAHAGRSAAELGVTALSDDDRVV